MNLTLSRNWGGSWLLLLILTVVTCACSFLELFSSKSHLALSIMYCTIWVFWTRLYCSLVCSAEFSTICCCSSDVVHGMFYELRNSTKNCSQNLTSFSCLSNRALLKYARNSKPMMAFWSTEGSRFMWLWDLEKVVLAKTCISQIFR